jgi:hypothetical protein
MRHLLTGVAIVAALAITAPVSAQRTGPGPGAPAARGGGTQLSGSTAAQLNAEELTRLQAGDFSMPPAPPPAAGAAPSSFERGPGRQLRRENAPSR